MTGKELINALVNNVADINLNNEVAIVTKDGAFENHEYAMFHIKEVNTNNNLVTLLIFDDIRHKGDKL